MDRGAWQATVHRVTKSRTQLKQLIMHMHAGLLLQKKRYRLNFSFLLGMLFRNVHIGNKKFLIGLFRSQVDVTSWKVKHLDPTIASHCFDSFFELMDCLGNMDIRNQFNAIICHILSWKMRSMELTLRVENLLRNLFYLQKKSYLIFRCITCKSTQSKIVRHHHHILYFCICMCICWCVYIHRGSQAVL